MGGSPTFAFLPEPSSITAITSGSHVVGSNKYARFHVSVRDGGAVTVDGTTVINSTAKVAVSASRAVNGVTGTIYTAPSDGYAIVQAHMSAGGTAPPNGFEIGGQQVPEPSKTPATSGHLYHIGPGQSFSHVVSGGGGTIEVSGVEFKLNEEADGWFRAPEAAVIAITGTGRVVVEEYDKA